MGASETQQLRARESAGGDLRTAPARIRTIVDVLAERARSEPDRVAYTFVQDSEGTLAELTYGDLFEQAAGFATLLQERGYAGERVLLVFKSNALFVIAFYACLLAGAIAVPTSPPRRAHLSHRLGLLARNAQVRAGIPDSDDVMQAAIALGPDDVEWFDIRGLMQRDELRPRARSWQPPQLAADALAFLQYTSGSTGDPKGVMVSHGNIMANCAAIRQWLNLGPATPVLMALPLFHDMGLVGGVLSAVYCDFPVHLMTPAQFVKAPELWLRLIARHRIRACGGPNFMFDLAARSVRPESIEDVDLSCWTAAFCGAEPIRSETVRLFTERFAGNGFQPQSFRPCYGMAETTLFVSGTALGHAPRFDTQGGRRPRPVVGCGRPGQDLDVRIVDPTSFLEVAAGEEGEVWIAGPSVAQGYWKRPDATEATFGARLTSDPGRGPFLRTGDLGYVTDGELFITGRLKDIVILRGRKFAPQDLETEAERSHESVLTGGSAAFSLDEGGEERLVVAAEVHREVIRQPQVWSHVQAAVRGALSRAFDVNVADVVLLRTGSLPRTSSGKVRRAQCRADYVAGSLGLDAERTPVTAGA